MVATGVSPRPWMSYWSSAPGVAVPVVLASSYDRSSSSSSSSKAPSSAAASSLSVSLTLDVITKRRGVWDDELGPIYVWPSIGMGGGGLP